MNELAERYGVAKMAVQKALNLLRTEGRVMSWQGRGAFVRGGTGDVENAAEVEGPEVIRRLDAVLDQLQSLEDRVAQLEAKSEVAEPKPGRQRGRQGDSDAR